jgi:hypothetical protein
VGRTSVEAVSEAMEAVGEDLMALSKAVVGEDPVVLGEAAVAEADAKERAVDLVGSRRGGRRGDGSAGMEVVEERARGWRGNDSSHD